jgi:hypothetical protein
VGLIAVPLGTWHHPDPARVVARRIGAPDARTIIGDIGVLQQSLLTRACRAVADGDVEVAVVAGAETKRRDGLRARAGLVDPSPGGPDGPGEGSELNGLENWLKPCCMPAHAPSRGAPRIKPTAVRRVAPQGSGFEGADFEASTLGLSGPTIASLLLTDRNRSERPPPNDQESGFRHSVGE